MTRSRLYGSLTVATLDTAIQRIERLHRVVEGYARDTGARGFESARTYAFVRELNREVADALGVAIRIADGAVQMHALSRPQSPR